MARKKSPEPQFVSSAYADLYKNTSKAVLFQALQNVILHSVKDSYLTSIKLEIGIAERMLEAYEAIEDAKIANRGKTPLETAVGVSEDKPVVKRKTTRK